MKFTRHWIPVLGILALVALFLKMPATPDVFGLFKCKTCGLTDPYLPLIGASYFALLTALSLLFPRFPSRLFAKSGLVWSILLAGTLTYIDLPNFCVACLMAHACHISMWVLWSMAPATTLKYRPSPVGERIFLTVFAPITVVALFGCLNLTFMVYQLKATQNGMATGLKTGEKAPLSFQKTVLNFVSPQCPYCQEQLPLLDKVATQFSNSSYRFINVSPALPEELIQLASGIEWLEDKEGSLREQFKVAGYPTLFVINADNTIEKVIPGVPQQLHADLLLHLEHQ